MQDLTPKISDTPAEDLTGPRAQIELDSLPPCPKKKPERFNGVDEKRVLNRSGMPATLGWFWQFFSWLMFRKVAFSQRHVDNIKEVAKAGDLVYVMNHHSVLDYLYFSYALKKRQLPLASFSNTIKSMLWFQPFWVPILEGLRRLTGYYKYHFEPSESLSYTLHEHRTSFVFLQKRQLWLGAEPDSLDDSCLITLLETQLDRLNRQDPRPITLMPQLLVWNQEPDRIQKSFWNTVFGETNAPGRLRKLINFGINRRRALVQVGKCISLQDFLSRHQGETSIEVLAAHLREELQEALFAEERVIKGPPLKGASQIRDEILSSEEVLKTAKELAESLGISDEKLLQEMSGHLKKISADFSITYIEVICMVLTLVFNRIYSEVVVDEEGLEGVREAGRKTPLVLIPCHRSHMDYLVLSYMFYTKGLIPPHIAAGSNLNFFPIGRVFRRSGAFFLRRSFGGDKGYSLAFRSYFNKLMKEGYWLEFFIEGGRSRTGKMLSPKFGLLKMAVDAIHEGVIPDLHFVPVYIGYDQVIEEEAFSKELGGGKKKKENFGALLSTFKVLSARYGRMYLNFAKPISCQDAIKTFQEDIERRSLYDKKEPEEDLETRFLHQLGYRISKAINDEAMVTPTSLVAAGILFHNKRGMSSDDLLARVGLILEFCIFKKARLTQHITERFEEHEEEILRAEEMLKKAKLYPQRFALGANSPLARARGLAVKDLVDEALERLTSLKQVERHEFEDEDIYVPVPTARNRMDFYKNNIVHLVIDEAIVATAIRSTMKDGATNVANILEAAAFLARTFQYEFVFPPEQGFGGKLAETLALFEEGGLIKRIPGDDFSQIEVHIPPSGKETLALLHRVLLPWIEAYWLIAEAIEFEVETSITEQAFIKMAQDLGARRYQVGDIRCPEAASSVNFKHALSAWQEFGLIEMKREGRDKFIIPVRPEGDERRFYELRDRLHTYFS